MKGFALFFNFPQPDFSNMPVSITLVQNSKSSVPEELFQAPVSGSMYVLDVVSKIFFTSLPSIVTASSSPSILSCSLKEGTPGASATGNIPEGVTALKAPGNPSANTGSSNGWSGDHTSKYYNRRFE